jgi:hypothetical protein
MPEPSRDEMQTNEKLEWLKKEITRLGQIVDHNTNSPASFGNSLAQRIAALEAASSRR